ncbi:hypothetical protein T484DRAFT_1814841 [Baffinella frigidus]|nr:hypothetical protein T484DRAFT_1814841 [Cryptophyta sp. CCMP2293]
MRSGLPPPPTLAEGEEGEGGATAQTPDGNGSKGAGWGEKVGKTAAEQAEKARAAFLTPTPTPASLTLHEAWTDKSGLRAAIVAATLAAPAPAAPLASANEGSTNEASTNEAAAIKAADTANEDAANEASANAEVANKGGGASGGGGAGDAARDGDVTGVQVRFNGQIRQKPQSPSGTETIKGVGLLDAVRYNGQIQRQQKPQSPAPGGGPGMGATILASVGKISGAAAAEHVVCLRVKTSTTSWSEWSPELVLTNDSFAALDLASEHKTEDHHRALGVGLL